ncbi:unnamed protein product [Orchesella dallaii]|uniref:Uncharacterized protein n=1 Tax=Orchesella dallaii TaxID=48710 RepID=A0ABP1S2L0_9HEXA
MRGAQRASDRGHEDNEDDRVSNVDGEENDDEVVSVIDGEQADIPENITVDDLYQDMHRMRRDMNKLINENRIYSRANRHLQDKNRRLESVLARNTSAQAQSEEQGRNVTGYNHNANQLPENWPMHNGQRFQRNDIAASSEFRNMAALNRNVQVEGVRNALAQITSRDTQNDAPQILQRGTVPTRSVGQDNQLIPRINDNAMTYENPSANAASAPNGRSSGMNVLNNGHAGWQATNWGVLPPQGPGQFTSGINRIDPNKEMRSLLKNLEPPTFTGKPDSKSAYDFLLQLEKYQSITGCSLNTLLK